MRGGAGSARARRRPSSSGSSCATRSARPSSSATRADNAEGAIQAIVVDGKSVESEAAGGEAAIIVNQTPFYAESGGQMGDSGVLFSAGGGEFAVRDTVKKAGELFVHLGTLTSGSLEVGDAVELRIDAKRRLALRANHSVTHLLHQALRRRLGEHVTQKGSLVGSDRMRFDFSHPKALTPEDLKWIEDEVNNRIRGNSEVSTRLMTPDLAVEAGALALFGEKYGDEVRVVAMGGEEADTKRAFLGRAVRRHACPAHRRYRLLQDRLGERRRGRRAPHRGADRRRGRGLCRAGGGAAAPGGGDAEGAARPSCRRASSASSRSGSASSAS